MSVRMMLAAVRVALQSVCKWLLGDDMPTDSRHKKGSESPDTRMSYRTNPMLYGRALAAHTTWR